MLPTEIKLSKGMTDTAVPNSIRDISLMIQQRQRNCWSLVDHAAVCHIYLGCILDLVVWPVHQVPEREQECISASMVIYHQR